MNVLRVSVLLLQMGKFAYFVSGRIFTLSTLGNAKATSLLVSSGSVRASNATLFLECELYSLCIMISGVLIKPVCVVLHIFIHISKSRMNVFDIFHVYESKESVFVFDIGASNQEGQL